MSSQSQAPPADVAALAGPGFLGAVFNTLLFGVLIVQTYLYYLAFPNDSRTVKGLVGTLFIVETVQTALLLYDAFEVYAVQFSNLSVLDDVRLTWLSAPVMCGIISCAVQLYFVYRIWILSRSKVICAGIALVSLTQCSAGIAGGALGRQARFFTRIGVLAFVPTTIWLTASAICDVMIAVTMIVCLRRRKSFFKETNILLTRLIRMAIETGTATATVAIVDVTLFLAFPDTLYFIAPSYVLAKLYSNTFMAILNSRMQIHGGRNERCSTRTTGSSNARSLGNASAHMPPEVHIVTDMWTEGIAMDDMKPQHGSRDKPLDISQGASLEYGSQV